MDYQCEGTTKAGVQCKKNAVGDSEFCAQHQPAENTDENVTDVHVAHIGPRPHGVGTIYDAPLEDNWQEVGTTNAGWEVTNPAETIERIEIVGGDNSQTTMGEHTPKPERKGFAVRRQPSPRCTIKSCHMVRGHGGKHENGSKSLPACSAKNCRLQESHDGPHGRPVVERTRIGELTGKL